VCPSWTTIATASPATIGCDRQGGGKSFTPGIMRKFCGCWIAEGWTVRIAESADERMRMNDPTIATSAPPSPRFATARQRRFGAASRSRNARPRRVRRVNTGPETRDRVGEGPAVPKPHRGRGVREDPVRRTNSVFSANRSVRAFMTNRSVSVGCKPFGYRNRWPPVAVRCTSFERRPRTQHPKYPRSNSRP